MGALPVSADLEKMNSVIKTHRNMWGLCESFIKSDAAADGTDAHSLDLKSISAAVSKTLGNKRA
jgi:hypothetical protein